MTVQKLRILAILLVAATFCACQKDPSTKSLHRDFLVYTACDTGTRFSEFGTYYVPDSILLIGESDRKEYWKDADALQIISTVVGRMNALGFTRTVDKDNADLGIQLSYVNRVTYYVGSDNPYWWWYYPYYWAPGYWGNWSDWYYPYTIYYGYTAGSLLIEMLNLEAAEGAGRKLPVVWDCFIAGLLTSSESVNLQRTLDGVNQAFEQSMCLKK